MIAQLEFFTQEAIQPTQSESLSLSDLIALAFGGPAPTVDEIQPVAITAESFPKHFKRIKRHLASELQTHVASLREDVARYLDLLARGVDALSDYDRNSPWITPEHSLVVALELKRNHIASDKGWIHFLESQLAQGKGIND